MNSALPVLLEQLQNELHHEKYLSSDPLEYVHHYSDPWDQEAVALLAAVLAYGNVKAVRRSIQDALSRIAQDYASPSGFVRSLDSPEGYSAAKARMKGFVHRFNVGADMALLFALLARSWKIHGSLGAHFLLAHPEDARHVGGALDALISDWRAWARELDPRVAKGSFGYLLTAPREGSCCKRWCMLLRWMGRKDQLDPGLWTSGSGLASTFPPGRSLRAAQLVIPLDTHTGRISQYLELTRRKSINWLAALEVTESLRACDPVDPTRYDFALARLGILDLCQRKYRKHICEQCQLQTACRFAGKHTQKALPAT